MMFTTPFTAFSGTPQVGVRLPVWHSSPERDVHAHHRTDGPPVRSVRFVFSGLSRGGLIGIFLDCGYRWLRAELTRHTFEDFQNEIDPAGGLRHTKATAWRLLLLITHCYNAFVRAKVEPDRPPRDPARYAIGSRARDNELPLARFFSGKLGPAGARHRVQARPRHFLSRGIAALDGPF
jgi:hypothetical protein